MPQEDTKKVTDEKVAKILAQREEEFAKSRKEKEIPKERAKEIVAQRDKEFKAARAGTPKMSAVKERLTTVEEIEDLNLYI